MSWRTTAVLFIILLLLVGYTYYQNQQEPEPTPVATLAAPTPEQFAVFAGASIDQIRGLQVDQPEEAKTAVFSRDDRKNWFQTVPTATQILSNTMEMQVTGLLSLRTAQSFAADVNPAAAYGLDTPAYIISLRAQREDGATVVYKLLVGDQTPTGSGFYIQKEGDPRVHIVNIGSIQNMIALLDNPPLPLPIPTPVITTTLAVTPTIEITTTVTPTP